MYSTPKHPKLILINGRKINTTGRIIKLTVSAKHTKGQIYLGVPTGINCLKNTLILYSRRRKNKEINTLKTNIIKNEHKI